MRPLCGAGWESARERGRSELRARCRGRGAELAHIGPSCGGCSCEGSGVDSKGS